MSMRRMSCALVAAGVVLVSGVWAGHAAAQTGEPITIRIRGASTLTPGAESLIVINGVVADMRYYQGLSSFDPDQFESVEILKGAAATALYGEAARNGVILIRTRGAADCPEQRVAPGGRKER